MVSDAKKETYFQESGVPVAESGKDGQDPMGKVIGKYLKLSKHDNCLLAIDKFIEWYVYDMAVIEVQNKFGTRYNTEYQDLLIKFIQQFILCAAHQTHHLV